MTQRELFEKIQHGETLDARESLYLEQVLESDDGLNVASLVEGLHDPEPSLAWRSELNEKLQTMAPKPTRPKRLVWFGSGLVATSLAACAIVFGTSFMGSGQKNAPVASNESMPVATNQSAAPESNDFEEALIQAHYADDAEVSAGLHSPRMVADSGYDWSSL